MEFNIGDIVETAVWVSCKRIPMGRGRVVAVHSGYCDVDHGYPHAAPWVYPEMNTFLRKIDNQAASVDRENDAAE